MDSPFVGMIAVFGFSWAPQDWALAQGQSVPVQQYQALLSLFGITYGGNYQTAFNLPDLRGRVVVGQGVRDDINYVVGNHGGAATVTLSTAQMPSHNHSATFTPGGGGSAAVEVQASQTPGNEAVPNPGDYISTCSVSSGPGAIKNFVKAADKGTTVALGGVTGGGGAGGTVAVGNTGGTTPVPVMQPYLVMNPCIALTGMYPMRPN